MLGNFNIDFFNLCHRQVQNFEILNESKSWPKFCCQCLKAPKAKAEVAKFIETGWKRNQNHSNLCYDFSLTLLRHQSPTLDVQQTHLSLEKQIIFANFCNYYAAYRCNFWGKCDRNDEKTPLDKSLREVDKKCWIIKPPFPRFPWCLCCWNWLPWRPVLPKLFTAEICNLVH